MSLLQVKLPYKTFQLRRNGEEKDKIDRDRGQETFKTMTMQIKEGMLNSMKGAILARKMCMMRLILV